MTTLPVYTQRKFAQRGFTLIEFLITLTLSSLLITWGASNFTRLVSDVRQTTQIDGLVDVLKLGQQSAISLRHLVTLCGSSTGEGCDNQWDKGYLLFSHPNAGDDYPASPNANKILYEKIRTTETYTLQANVQRLTFRETGIIRGQSGSLLYCPKDAGEKARRLAVSKGGRIRVYSYEQWQTLSASSQLGSMSCP